jgi:hypothetical protein
MSWKSPLRRLSSKRRPGAADPDAPSHAPEDAPEGPPSAPIRVLHAAAELYPRVNTGGLGDVMAALPPSLGALGNDVRLVLPGFTPFLDAFELREVARLRTPFAAERVRIVLARLPDSAVSGRILSIIRRSMTGRARRIRPRTGRTGPTTTGDSRC